MVGTSVALGAVLRGERRRQGLTIEDLALRCDVGPRAIGELERGKPTTQVAVLLKIVSGLRMTLAVTPDDD